MLLRRAIGAIVTASLLSFFLLHVYHHSDAYLAAHRGKLRMRTRQEGGAASSRSEGGTADGAAATSSAPSTGRGRLEADSAGLMSPPLEGPVPARGESYQSTATGQSRKSAVKLPVSSGPVEVKAAIPEVRRISIQDFLADRTYIDRGYEKKYYHSHNRIETVEEAVVNYKLNRSRVMCSADVVSALEKPMLSTEEIKWCKWAVSPSGGRVIVGKSWGAIASNNDKAKFEFLNCNYVSLSQGDNPSCNDQWGDIHVKKWLQNPVKTGGGNDLCDSSLGFQSQLRCYDNTNKDRFCTAEKVIVDFGGMRSVGNNKRDFPNNLFSLDCNSKDDRQNDNIFQFKHMMSMSVDKEVVSHCDYYINGTALIFSHDHILNLGHTQQDYMNVFLMLWMDSKGLYSQDIPLITIDGMRLYNSREDLVTSFYEHYSRTFSRIYRANDFNGKRVCIDRIITQPIPPKLFVWDRWTDDIPCTFKGPSSLFQRFNLNIRHRYNMLARRRGSDAQKVKIVLIVRKASKRDNAWGTLSTSRNFLNYEETLRRLKEYAKSADHDFQAVNIGTLSFQKQFELISKTSILVGMHGAGISALVNMPLGDDNCCGLIEMFPQGEQMPARGYGNMARRMGIKYTRIEISAESSKGDGAVVPIDKVIAALGSMAREVKTKPTCLLPAVIADPAFRHDYLG